QFYKLWSSWLPAAAFFHFGTKDVRYCSTGQDIQKVLKRLIARSPQPDFFKTYEDVRNIKLPCLPPHQGEFVKVLTSRRTHRRFESRTISLNHLSTILYYAWGVTGFIRSSTLGDLPLKTSPSAGARHPIEVYVVNLRVRGLAPGIYHYATRNHSLEQLSLGHFDKRAVRYCADQSWVRGA